MAKQQPVQTGANLETESMELYDYCQPDLPSGSWEIATNQEVVWKKQGINQSYGKNQAFTIDGPRFTMKPSMIHSAFPPATSGVFENVLPHLVLNKRTIPWQRMIWGNNEGALPWVALIVVEEDEIYIPSADDTQDQRVLPRTVGDLVTPGTGILGPQGLQPAPSGDELQAPCLTIDIDASIFSAILPTKEELPYLSHCRKVDLSSKEPNAEVTQEEGEGWFSVVVGNRFPASGKKAFSCLVSLEGFTDYLPGGSKAGDVSNYQAVRMACLASWNFTSLAQGTPSFSALMKNIDAGILQMPQASAAGNGNLTPAQQFVAEALSDGYVPMTYETRVGEKTVAWFRGPFSPVIIKEDDDLTPIFSAEAAMIYDQQKTGMFDVSYAVAWQIGRLLALSDREFALGMLQWMRSQHQETLQQLNRERFARPLRSLLEVPDHALSSISQQDLHKKTNDLLGEHLPRLLLSGGANGSPILATRDKTQLKHLSEQLPGVLAQKELLSAVGNGQSLVDALREKIFTEK